VKQNRTSPSDLDQNPEATLDDTRNSEAELFDFARQTLAAAIKFETMKYGAKPSISLFCRMDIGLIHNQNSGLDYFVNEVERTATVGLWSGGQGNRRCAGLVAVEFSKCFPAWLDEQIQKLQF
jgi:hypothetical protein